MSEKKVSSGAEKAEELSVKHKKQGAEGKAQGAEMDAHDENAKFSREKESLKQAKAEAAKAKKEARLNAESAEHERKLKERAERGENKKQRAPGFGGWLAATIALGVTTLTLGTMLTFGWLNMNNMEAGRASDASHSLYELNAIVDNLDANLSKARIASSKGDRAKIFTDIALESEMAEGALERLPVAGELTRSITSFINKMGESAQNMIVSVAREGDISSSQQASIEYMYEYNAKLKQFLNELIDSCDEKAIYEALAGKGAMYEGFEGYTDPAVETPREIYDGPFAENTQKTNAKALDGLEEITPERAEELAIQYFADYGVTQADCTGEAVAKQLVCLNVQMTGDDGEYFAQFSKQGGKLVMFDSFKECSEHKFDMQQCKDIAERFLSAAGYDNMMCVWASESGTTCNLNYVYSDNGTAVYPDMVKIKVCEERGRVTGIEALPYVLNHTERKLDGATISKAQAKAKLGKEFNVTSSMLALIPEDGKEVLAYEFCGTYGGRTYYVYLSAETGEEVAIFTVVGSGLM